MTIILDTAPLVSLADRADPRRNAVRRILSESRELLIIPAPVTAEVDYFLRSRFPPVAARNFLLDLSMGRFGVECLSPPEYSIVERLGERYAALRPGLADLSLVVLAQRFRTRRLMTFDDRDFRAMSPLQGGQFTILPADNPGPTPG